MPDPVLPVIPVLEIVLRTLAIYAAFVIALRLAGKRELGQVTILDLGVLVLAANALQPAMTGPDASIGGALVIIVTLFTANALAARLLARSSRVRRLVNGEPIYLARRGSWDMAEIGRQRITADRLDLELRRHGVDDVRETRLVVLEEDGTISVIPRETDEEALARHRRGGGELRGA